MTRPVLTLGHSPDPDDAFMWWPITGMVRPDGTPLGEGDGEAGRPAIDTGRFEYRAVPADIETLNRRAAAVGDLDITAISARAYADVASSYLITRCGASFGEGYGPKLVTRSDSPLRDAADVRARRPLIAVPGARTTAFLTLSLLLGGGEPFQYREMPFDAIQGAVARGEVGAGLIIHEGQLTFADHGLRQIADVGAWWRTETGLPLPLGLNAVRRDLDQRFGPGTIAEVAAVLRRSLDHALAHRARSIDYAMSFAMANEGGAGGGIDRGRVDTFVSMYVNRWTVDMGEEGRRAVERLLARGAERGLCPAVGAVEMI